MVRKTPWPTCPLIEKLGGVEAVRRELAERHGINPVHTMRNWLLRGRLSADAMLMLMEIADERRIRYQRKDFIITTPEP